MERTYLYYDGALVDTINTKMDLRKIVKIKVTPANVIVVGVDGFSAVPSSTMRQAMSLLRAELPKGVRVYNGYNHV